MAKVKVRTNDELRCLVTDVLPAETPIIFSNDGFYLRCANHKYNTGPASLIFKSIVSQEPNFRKRRYVPYAYRIKKSALSYRQLSVVHPGAQWQMKNFYKRFWPLILHYTRGSKFSIRAPRDLAKTYFIKSSVSDLARFKKSAAAAHEDDKHLRHSSSFFSYRGYTRLYKFFDSQELIELESMFSHFWMIDVTKCFDSIYTHSISWAVKDKPFSKESTTGITYFGDTFDCVMQSMNYGETSGIVIGPEFSRVFSEVLLQSVDAQIERRLLQRSTPMVFGVDYSIRRYVDDYFLFCKSSADASLIYKVISEELAKYKLSVNEAKLEKHERPFLTDKSRTIIQISAKLNLFVRKVAQEIGTGKDGRLVPRKIYRPDRLSLSFCNEIKLCCAENSCEYDEVSGYLISALKNRATKLMQEPVSCNDPLDQKLYAEALIVLLSVMLFLYAVAPSVNSSYKLCASIIMIVRFSERLLPERCESVKQFVFAQASSMLRRKVGVESDSYVDLEAQNLMLAVGDLGEDYRLDPETLSRMFGVGRRGPVSYFDLVTLIYYIKDDPSYAMARSWAMAAVDEKIGRLERVHEDAEQALTFLDFLACPYIDLNRKNTWLTSFYAMKSEAMNFTVDELVADLSDPWWFVNWKEIDLLNLLERRELHSVY